MEINPRIANLVRDIASAEGRSEEEVLDEALALYLRLHEAEDEPNLGRFIRRIRRRVPQSRSYAQRDPLPALLDRISSRFDLDEDEAMRIAVEEQHAFREERAERQRRRTGR